MENDLISRSALSGKAKWMKDQFGIPLRAIPISELGLAPAVDAVEVVRCKDCIYYETGKDYLPYCNHADGGIDDYPREDDFCSYGERRDNNG